MHIGPKFFFTDVLNFFLPAKPSGCRRTMTSTMATTPIACTNKVPTAAICQEEARRLLPGRRQLGRHCFSVIKLRLPWHIGYFRDPGELAFAWLEDFAQCGRKLRSLCVCCAHPGTREEAGARAGPSSWSTIPMGLANTYWAKVFGSVYLCC